MNLPAISLIFRNVMHFRMVIPGQQINSNNNSSRQHGNSSNHLQNEPLHHQLYNPLMQRKMCPQIGSNINKVTGNNNSNNNNNSKQDNNGSKMYSLLGSEYVAFLADWELTLSFKFKKKVWNNANEKSAACQQLCRYEPAVSFCLKRKDGIIRSPKQKYQRP